MNKYVVVIILGFILNQFSYASTSNLEGTYNCGGAEVDTNERFKCSMTIQKTDQTYSLKSTCTGNSTYIGTGIYNAPKRILSIAFINPNNKDETGVIMVEVKPNNKLVSTWTYLNKTTVAKGYCTKKIR